MPESTKKAGAARDEKGRFVKGRSGNAGGRAKKTQAERAALEMLKAAAPEAVTIALDMLRNEGTAPALRVKIIEMVLNRTYGKEPAEVADDAKPLVVRFEGWSGPDE